MTNNAIDVAIIGAGFAGLAAAIRLKQETQHTFIVFERATEVGGTWRDNVYPGCACDVPSHLYSFSFAPNPTWSRAFSPQPEILNYLKDCVGKYELQSHIRYNSDVNSVIFDENLGVWQVSDRNGESFTAKVVISATGPLNRPSIPKLKGIENFQGKAFHSSKWDKEVDLTNKNVVLIGTGASAIQIVPNIALKVRKLTLFQRTPPWVTARLDRNITSFEKTLFKTFPFLQMAYRGILYWIRELMGLSFIGNKLLSKVATWGATKQLEDAIKDPILREKLTPKYQIGCKRILVSNDYYPALTRENVQLVTEGIEEVKTNSIIAKDGSEHPADVIIYGTGFVVSEIIMDLKVIGLDQRNLLEEWKETGPEAYYGMSISGFPNFLFLVGPNTGLGHNSIVHMIESQMNYVMSYLKLLEKGGEKGYLDMKFEVQKTFNVKLQDDLKNNTVWAKGGCQSWYFNSKGKNTTLWSGLTVRYRKETRRVKEDNYLVSK